jgi:alkylation response protein AidB-like acyl-CoA dehydrogenase
VDFHFTPEEESFRQEVRTFVRREWQPSGRGEADDEREQFIRKLAAKGWLTMSWPKEYGGQEASHMKQLVYNEEMAYHGANGQTMGSDRLGPTVILFGTDEQKQKFLPPITRGEVLWCQGFSEPGSGSDLASLQTRAVLDGDHFVVNGQKIWTSGAHRADYIFLLVRTDPEAPKHRGISFLLVDMKSPGITVQPLTQMTGDSGFNQLFFDNVRVPRENLVGEMNRGWYIAAATLDFERSGINRIVAGERTFDELVAYAKEAPRAGGGRLFDLPHVRNALADFRIGFDVGRYLAYRVAWMQSQKLVPNYEASMSKLFGTEMQQRLARFAINSLGLSGQLRSGPWAPLAGKIANYYLSTVSLTIAAGTSEVNRNIIAGRGLGLPRD